MRIVKAIDDFIFYNVYLKVGFMPILFFVAAAWGLIVGCIDLWLGIPNWQIWGGLSFIIVLLGYFTSSAIDRVKKLFNSKKK